MLRTLAAAALAAATPFGAQERAPAFQLPAVRATRFVGLSDFAGKVVLIDVERSTCPRSAAQAPALAALRARYQPSGLEVLTVYDELPGDADPFARALADATKKGFVHPLALNDGGEFHEGYYRRIASLPAAFLVSRSGMLTFLGEDPLGGERGAATARRIEAMLAEPAPSAAAPATGGDGDAANASRPSPGAFSLLSYSGGVLRSQDFAGMPSVVAALAPGALADRLTPSLEALAKKWGDRSRNVAIAFCDFEPAAALAAGAPSVQWGAPDPRTAAALGASRIPQILFLDSNGKVVKRIGAFYGVYGVEGAVLDRTLQCLLAEAGTLDRPAKVESRAATSETTPEALAKARAEFAKAHTNYRVDKEEKLPDGRVLVKDRWDEGGQSCSGMRLFVPTTKGFIELRNLDPLRDAAAFATVTKSMAESTVVGR